MIETIRKEWQAKVAVALFILFTLWWVYNNFILDPASIKYDGFGDWAELYGIMALWGAIWGIHTSSKWGGIQSVIGKGILMFSLGLLMQEFGQLAYALYYDLYKVPGPYPSLGDLGFFGSIPFYTYGVWLLGKASGVKIGLQSTMSKIQAVIIPAALLLFAYLFFMQGYEFDWSNPVKIFLDFGYPFGQAIYVSLAFLTFLLSRGVLGGVMKYKILFILFALLVQFLSDYIFLYQSSKGIYSVGQINDYIYFVAYFIMTLGLLNLKTVVERLQKD